MRELFITVTALPVFHMPGSGWKYIMDSRDGYIVSPGYPGQYPNGVNSEVWITTSTATVSLLLQ